jgi:hypothetical protein
MSDIIDKTAVDELRDEVRDWEATEVAQFLKKQSERKTDFLTLGDNAARRYRFAGAVSVYARPVPDDVPLAQLDDASDRRFRDGRRYERSL